MPHAMKAGGFIMVKTDYSENAAMDMVPGSRWRAKETLWRCPLSMPTCYTLRAVFKDRLTVDDRLTEWAIAEGERWIKACSWLTNPNVLSLPPSDSIGPSTLRDAVAAFEKVDSESELHLKPYQAVAAVQMVLAQGSINGSDMGVGKTPTAIVAMKIAHELFEQGKVDSPWPLLIVCPNSLKKNWAREMDKWWPEQTYEVIRGTAKQKRDAFARAEGGRSVIINYDSLRSFSRLAAYGSIRMKRCDDCGGMDSIRPSSCHVHERELNHTHWRTVLADEAHRIKDPTTDQSRALEYTAKHALYRWAMTGTLIERTPVDLWPLLHFVAPKEFPTRTGYIDRHVQRFFDPFGGVTFGGLLTETEPELRKTLDARLIRHTKAQVLPYLPKKQYELRTHELRKDERAAYNSLRKSLIADVDGGQVIAWNPMVQMGRLLQMAESTVEVAEDGTITQVEPSSKLDALTDTLADYPDEPVVIFFVSRQLLHLYEARLTKAKTDFVSYHGGVSEKDRDAAIQAFQGGKVNRILLTAQAGGEGLTLTRSKTLIVVRRPHSSILSSQIEDRIDRIGSEGHDFLKIIDIVAEDTVELEVRDTLVQKKANLEEIVQDAKRMRALIG